MDIFLRDRVAGTTQRMSLFSTGAPATWRSVYPTISGNGAFVAYDSSVPLTPDDTNTSSEDDIFATKREVIAPQTTITSGPSGTVTATSVSFTFGSNEVGSRFTCSLDGKPFEPCAGTKTYPALAKGSHTFDVRATDASSNTDETPARRTWTIN